MKYKVGDEVRVKRTNKETMYKHIEGTTVLILNNVCNDLYQVIDCVGGQWILDEEMLEPVIPTISEIINKEMSCVIHTKTKDEAELLADYMPQTSSWSGNPCDNWDYYGSETGYYIANGKLAQYARTSFYEANYPEYGEIYEFSDLFATGGKIPTPSKPVSIEEQLGLPKGVSIHDLPTSEWYNPMRLDLPEFVFDAKQAKELAERLNKELAGRFNAFPNNGISAKNGGKNSMKFTFYVTDWVDINKTNGEKIPMKRTVAYIGSNTDVKADTSCPVTEYDERTGCLIVAAKISAKRSTEAKMMYNIARSTWGTELSWAILFELANTAFNDNFERAYKKFHNDNIRFEKKRLTCNFCGKVFETIEEKTQHENEHIQNKKNKRERYLLRKRAKEIAFEEQAQKMAKEIMKEDK